VTTWALRTPSSGCPPCGRGGWSCFFRCWSPAPCSLLAGAGAGDAATPGLVAAYSFDANAGTSAADASGNGRTGTISGAAWTSGRYGPALDFDGVDDRVNLPPLGTFYKTGFTLEAWAKKRTTKLDAAIAGTWIAKDAGGPLLWVDDVAGRYYLTLNKGVSNYLNSSRTRRSEPGST